MRAVIEERQAEIERKAALIEQTQQRLRAQLAQKRETVFHRRNANDCLRELRDSCERQVAEIERQQRQLHLKLVLLQEPEKLTWNK